MVVLDKFVSIDDLSMPLGIDNIKNEFGVFGLVRINPVAIQQFKRI